MAMFETWRQPIIMHYTADVFISVKLCSVGSSGTEAHTRWRRYSQDFLTQPSVLVRGVQAFPGVQSLIHFGQDDLSEVEETCRRVTGHQQDSPTPQIRISLQHITSHYNSYRAALMYFMSFLTWWQQTGTLLYHKLQHPSCRLFVKRDTQLWVSWGPSGGTIHTYLHPCCCLMWLKWRSKSVGPVWCYSKI